MGCCFSGMVQGMEEMAKAQMRGIEASYRPVLRDVGTVAIQFQLIAGHTWPLTHPNEAEAQPTFPLLTEEIWQDWIGRFNDYIKPIMDEVEAEFREKHSVVMSPGGAMAAQAEQRRLVDQLAGSMRVWCSQPDVNGVETRSLMMQGAAQVTLSISVESMYGGVYQNGVQQQQPALFLILKRGAPPAALPQTPGQPGRFCNQCAAPIVPGSKFCSGCATPVA